ncbi:hypothetical protein GCM10010207_75940 [Streptomyces atratus]|nr:hypothetical protein GCM10010207_75940 [Streptomyces atratus]
MRDANSLVATVFSGLSALVIDDVADDGEVIRVLARTRDAPFPCPMCGVPTGKVHGYHVRTVADVPVDGRRVVVNVRVRRLVCPVLGCRRQTFREQVPGLITWFGYPAQKHFVHLSQAYTLLGDTEAAYSAQDNALDSLIPPR